MKKLKDIGFNLVALIGTIILIGNITVRYRARVWVLLKAGPAGQCLLMVTTWRGAMCMGQATKARSFGLPPCSINFFPETFCQ
jgi:hypothetical protein